MAFSFILGFEESYGYLKGTYARDKDAVEAAVMVCEMAAYYRSKGMTLEDAMNAMYEKYGYYVEKTVNLPFGVGTEGKEKMETVMRRIRENPPKTLGTETVVQVIDYYERKIFDLRTGDILPCAMERSNVIRFETEEKNVVVVRPSGTEPKIKMYYLLHGADAAGAQAKLKQFEKSMDAYARA